MFSWWSLLRFVLTIVTIAVPVGIVLWITWTHDLHLDVYSADTYWYREDFPTYLKVIVTVILSLILGLIAAGVIWIVRYSRRSSPDSKKDAKCATATP